jgi:AcrR family transcriptional regulator
LSTYDIILQAARRLFIRKGYTATSIREIAEEAGIGKATIYHHFPDKQAIILALMRGSAGRQDEILAAIRAEQDPRRRIETAVTASIQFLLDMVELMQIVRREVPGGREYVQAEYASYLKEFRALLGGAVQQGTEQGIFRSVNPAQASSVLMTMIQGTYAMVHLGGERPGSPEKAAAALLDIFFYGIEAR